MIAFSRPPLHSIQGVNDPSLTSKPAQALSSVCEGAPTDGGASAVVVAFFCSGTKLPNGCQGVGAPVT